MKERTLGDRLRIRRLKLNRSLKDIEKETNIPLHYLLALELNRFDAIPVEDLDHYISAYAKAVSLAEEENANLNLTVKETVPQAPEQPAYEPAASPQALPVEKLEPLSDDSNATTQTVVNESIVSEGEKPESVSLSRAGRRRYYSVRNWLVGLSIVLILSAGTAFAWLWWQQSSQLPVSKQTATSRQKTTSQSTTASSTQTPQLTVSQDANGATVVTLSQATRPVTIEVSLSGEASSWVSMSNTDLSSEGVLLTAQQPSVTATLDAGATSSQFVFGYPEAVTVTINGQKLDMTTITSAANTATLNVTEGD